MPVVALLKTLKLETTKNENWISCNSYSKYQCSKANLGKCNSLSN